MPLSFWRFATQVAELDVDGLFARYEELFECVDPDDPNQRETALQLAAMISRHGKHVLSVVANEISRSRAELADGSLPETCLLRLIAGSQVGQPKGQWHGDDYRKVLYEGEWRDLTTNQARVVEYLATHLGDAPSLNQSTVLGALEIKSRTFYQVFRRSWAWLELIVPDQGRGMFRLNIQP